MRAIEADFQLWPPSPALFDLVLCSEVVEHVAKAGPFVQKVRVRVRVRVRVMG